MTKEVSINKEDNKKGKLKSSDKASLMLGNDQDNNEEKDAEVDESKNNDISEGGKLPGKKGIPLKKQLKEHLQIVHEVAGFSVITVSKEGKHAVASTYPEEIANLIILYHFPNALTESEKDVIRLLVGHGLTRIHKKDDEESEPKGNLVDLNGNKI